MADFAAFCFSRTPAAIERELCFDCSIATRGSFAWLYPAACWADVAACRRALANQRHPGLSAGKANRPKRLVSMRVRVRSNRIWAFNKLAVRWIHSRVRRGEERPPSRGVAQRPSAAAKAGRPMKKNVSAVTDSPDLPDSGTRAFAIGGYAF